jgi:hypothetical protein
MRVTDCPSPRRKANAAEDGRPCVGEYVLPILLVIHDRLSGLDTPETAQHEVYGTFVAANAGFFERIRQRVASYRRCCYRACMPNDAATQAGPSWSPRRKPRRRTGQRR